MKNTEKNTSRKETPPSYEAPVLESLEVEVEKGFAESGPPLPSYDSPAAPEPNKGPWR